MRGSDGLGRAFFGIATAACLACSTAEPPPAAAGPPSFLLVTLDTTRADRLGAYGYERADTPNLDRLAREGVRFASALATAPVTLPSHTSILSGVIPPVHGVRDNAIFVLGPDALLLPEVLQAHGWRTGAFVGSYVLDGRFGLDQGFEVYRSVRHSVQTPVSHPERRADEVVDDALAWLGTLPQGERFFAWVHFYDPHEPYAAPEPWSREHPDPHDAEVAFSDAQLGRLLRWLEKQGLANEVLVVVTADHGESFGEHGEDTHATFVYDSAMRVPLILWGAPVASLAGTVVDDRVSNVDLAPTLLELAGIPPVEMPAVAGTSLLGPAGRAAPLYVETFNPYYSHRWHAFRGLVWEDHKLIAGRQAELYDLAEDPGELVDLAAAEPERLARMRARLDDVLEAAAPLGWAGENAPGAAEQAALAALGYLEASTGGDPFDPSLPDPRDRVGDIAMLERSGVLMAEAMMMIQDAPPAAWQQQEARERARERWAEARDLLRGVVRENPDDPVSLHRLGNLEIALENYDEAVRVLETVVDARPSSAVAHFNLGLALRGAGQGPRGLAEIERAVELEPKHPQYRMQLAMIHLENGDWDTSARHLDRLAQALPEEDPLTPTVRGLRERLALEAKERE